MSQMQTKMLLQKDCPYTAGTSLEPDQNISTQLYSPSTILALIVTVSYAVPQSKVLTILNKLAKENKQSNNLKEI